MKRKKQALQRLGVVGLATATATIGLPLAAMGSADAATTAPGAPTGLTATDTGAGQITLSWTAPTTGSAPLGYNVYEGTNGPGSENANAENGSALITGTTTTVNGLSTTNATYFVVEAVNSVGSSGPSNEASATAAAVAPTAPTNVVATPGNGTVTLTWTASTSSGNTSAASYQVFEGTTSGAEGTTPVATTTAGTTTATVSGLTNGTKYYFTVKATNTSGLTSPASAEVSATPAIGAPAAPVLTVAGATSSTVSLTWTTPANNGSAVTGYNVYEGTSAGGESTTPVNGSVPLTGNSLAVPNLTAGTTYYFTVKAINSLGTSPASNEVSATPTVSAPGAPTGLTATPGYDSATLSFTAPTVTGSSAITGYTVLQSTNATSGFVPVSGIAGEAVSPSTGTGTTVTVTGLTDGTPYYFQVEANNSSTPGTSAPSNVASATPAPSAPSAPLNVQATENGTADTVTVTWATPANQGSTTAPTYNVYQGTPGSGTAIATAVAGNTFTTTALSPNTAYTFYVESQNALGFSGASNSATTTTGVPTPGAPTGLTATVASSSSATLTFQQPANLGGGNESYQVFAGTSPGGESSTPLGAYVPAVPGVSPAVIGVSGGPTASTTTPGSETVTVSGLAQGSTYYFTVKAVSTPTGGVASASAASNEASIAPVSVPGAPTGVTVTNIEPTTATVSFTAPVTTTGNGAATSYTVTTTNTSVTPNAPGPGCTTTGSATSCNLTGLTLGDTYTVSVTATNSAGSSAAAGTTSFTTAVGATSAPTGLTATANGTYVSLSWTAPTTLNGSTIAYYNIYEQSGTVGSPNPTTSAPVGTATGTSAIIDNLQVGTTYEFSVTAVTTTGTHTVYNGANARTTAAGQESPISNVVQVTPTTVGAPSAPGNPVAVAGANAGTIVVTWTAPTNTGGSAITDYLVVPYLNGVAGTPIDTKSTNTSYTVTGLTGGDTYSFTVEAVNAIGDSAQSNLSTPVVAPTSGTAPGAIIPTIKVGSRVGRGVVPITGQATPGTTAYLYYQPYGSTQYLSNQHKVVGSNGLYSFVGTVQKSTYYYVETSGKKSAVERAKVYTAVGLTATGGVHSVTFRITANPAVTELAYLRQNLANGAVPRLKTVRLSSSGTTTVTIPVSATGTIAVSVRAAGGYGGYGGTSATRTVTVRS